MTWAGFVGADPVALVNLADLAEQYVTRMSSVGAEADRVLGRHDRSVRGQGPGVVLGAIEALLLDDAAKLRWRADSIDAAQALGVDAFGLGSYLQDRAIFASHAVFDLTEWSTAFRRWNTLPTPGDLAAMAPNQVAATLGDLAPHLVQVLVTVHPQLLGGLDGAPPEVRYAANRIVIELEIDRLEAQIEELKTDQETDRFGWVDPDRIIGWFSVSSLTERAVSALEERVAEYRLWLAEDRQILLFDPAGDGRVVEVFGDLTLAERVGVVVPGMDNDMGNFSHGDGGFRTNAQQLHEASLRLGPLSIATVAWLGYDTPDGVDAAGAGAARAGAPALTRFLEGIDPEADKQLTLVAHSYGSVLAGLAAQDGLEVNDIVFVGSPGTTLDRAGEANLRPGGRVWSALASNDPIAVGISPDEFPPWWVPPVLAPSWLLVDFAVGGAEELWHGTNPASDEFGARRFATDGSSGHSSYFEAVALLNLARIVQGLYSEVELVD